MRPLPYPVRGGLFFPRQKLSPRLVPSLPADIHRGMQIIAVSCCVLHGLRWKTANGANNAFSQKEFQTAVTVGDEEDLVHGFYLGFAPLAVQQDT